MNICIPVTENLGLDSPVCGHFGSAPMFLIVDSNTRTCRQIDNRNLNHQHGMCQPLLSIQGEKIDAIVVGGIGMGALMKLKSAGIKVFLAESPTVGTTVDAFAAGRLSEVDPEGACGGHGHGPHGCGGHH